MSSGNVADPVGNTELLARFVLFENRVRADGTVKPEAFMPPTSLELSVTRHKEAATAQLWERGEVVAAASNRNLVGRADIAAGAVRAVRPLDVIAAPLESDSNHAHVIGWPPMTTKPAQKALAQSLAAAATFVRR